MAILGILNLSFKITVAVTHSLCLLEIIYKTHKQKTKMSGAVNASHACATCTKLDCLTKECKGGTFQGPCGGNLLPMHTPPFF